MELKKFLVRSRAIIVHDNKLLIVRHAKSDDSYALPGGHIELGEDVRGGLKREIIEELGVEPKIGRLLYLNNFAEGEIHFIEFFFEITNGIDYLDIEKLKGTHSFELAEICWTGKGDDKDILPKQIKEYLDDGSLVSDNLRFI